MDFAAVVTQTRARKDTALSVEGDIARTWMENAQCFAGPPETPPAPGSRHRQDAPRKRALVKSLRPMEKAILTCALTGVLTDPNNIPFP